MQVLINKVPALENDSLSLINILIFWNFHLCLSFLIRVISRCYQVLKCLLKILFSFPSYLEMRIFLLLEDLGHKPLCLFMKQIFLVILFLLLHTFFLALRILQFLQFWYHLKESHYLHLKIYPITVYRYPINQLTLVALLLHAPKVHQYQVFNFNFWSDFIIVD